MRAELTIKADYLPSWGSYEGLRELVQNGQDAKTEFGATFNVRYRKDVSTLVLENDGCTLPHEALLFGHTTKSERSDLIGKFGEGLKLGVLALVRAGHAVKIRSGSEVWIPKIERSETYNADVLTFQIEKGREPKNRVQIEIGNVAEDNWARFYEHFLFLAKLPKGAAIKTPAGTLLVDPKYKGRVYVKGIFVTNAPDQSYGYDLQNASVDRDRRMVDQYDLRYYTQAIWRHAMVQDENLVGNFISLLENETADVAGINDMNVQHLGDAVKDKAADHFAKKHGELAIPVSTLADSAEVEHLGKKGVVCPAPLRLVLEQRLGTVTENKAKLAKETVRLFGWHDLTIDEKESLEQSLALINAVSPVSLADVDVAEYRDPKLYGLWKDGRIQIARKLLVDRAETRAVLVHELAHKLGGGDGEKGHVANIEKLWSGIVDHLITRGSA